MKQYLYIFILNNFVLFGLVMKLVNRSSSKLTSLILLVVCLLIFGCSYQLGQLKSLYNSNSILTGEDKRIDIEQLELKNLDHLDRYKMVSYFKIFNIPRQFNNSQLKQSYKHLIKQLHPDQGGDQNTFIAIRKIYQVLQSDQKRSYYDLYGVDIDGNDEQKSFQIIKIGESIMLYFVCLIFSIMFTYQSGQIITRTSLVIFNLSFLWIEMQYYQYGGLNMGSDLLDIIVPEMLLFQRIHLMRIMISGLILVIRLVQATYCPSIESVMMRLSVQTRYKETIELQDQLMQQLKIELDSQERSIKQYQNGQQQGWLSDSFKRKIKVLLGVSIVLGVGMQYIDGLDFDDDDL